MNRKKTFETIKDLIILALLATILYVQEEVLTFLPNIQLTIFLIVLYSKKLGFKKTSFIIIIHVFLDNLAMGSLNFVYTPFMFAGWELIPLLLSTVFKDVDDSLHLALLGILFALIYCWIFIIPGVLISRINILAYIASDMIFEIILATSSFVSILWLYDPCSKVFDKFL